MSVSSRLSAVDGVVAHAQVAHMALLHNRHVQRATLLEANSQDPTTVSDVGQRDGICIRRQKRIREVERCGVDAHAKPPEKNR